MAANNFNFNNEFNLVTRDLSEIEIKETSSYDKCLIWDKNISEKVYNRFIISENSLSKNICEISFHVSSKTNKYIPRLIFKRIAKNGEIQSTKSKDKVIIKFTESKDAILFWKLISFIYQFKEIVDIEEFDSNFQVVSKDAYILEFKNKAEKQKVEDLKELIGHSNLDYNQLKSLTFENRKKNLLVFFYLLKNKNNIQEKYREKYELMNGEEYIWHHFLKNNDWILGLNTDLKFIRDLLSEQKIGIENSQAKESPTVDLLGFSEFTTLIELKHSSTPIFKKSKSKGRANTWDFTSDFIEGLSQCLGHKNELEKSFGIKNIINGDKRFKKDGIENIDPKTVLLIGNKKREFPINDLNNDNILKNNTLERFRRNNRNIDILSFDELFERAYHIVYSKKLDENWFWKGKEDLFPA